jgi:hypothetical protein
LVTTATWWSAQQAQQAAEGPRFFGSVSETRKGSFGGECFYVACKTGDARWYNKANVRYYCETCASAINAGCELLGEPQVCNKHV